MLRRRPLFTKIFLSIFICFIIPVIIAGNIFYHYAATDAVEQSDLSVLSDGAFRRGAHYFKEQTGVPFSQYVNRFRVDRAKRLLAEPQSQVKLVAQQVGFENVNTFIRVFKSFEGISPGVYKETLLKKESDADPR